MFLERSKISETIYKFRNNIQDCFSSVTFTLSIDIHYLSEVDMNCLLLCFRKGKFSEFDFLFQFLKGGKDQSLL